MHHQKDELKILPLDEIDEPSRATRRSIDQEQLNELARSIQQVGVLEPILVRPRDGRYEIIAGHRRFLASQLARRATIPCICTSLNTDEAMQGQLHENLFRADPTDDEYASLFADLTERCGWSIEQISHAAGKGEAFVRSRLQILSYPDDLREALIAGQISLSAAKELAAIDNEQELTRLLHYATQNGITARTAAAWRQAYESARIPTDIASIQPATTGYGSHPGPPMYPCFGCQRPEDLNNLTVVRFCRHCLAAISTTTNHDNLQTS